MKDQYVIAGLGEILWDCFPEGKRLGGAPANFAFHATVLGNEGISASCIGSDNMGREILDRLRTLGLSREYIQIDSVHPTGTVEVDVDRAGHPQYTITQYVAWDYIQWNDRLRKLSGMVDAVCFGSLAQRSPVSRETIQHFLKAVRDDALRIFDINLRQSFYTKEILNDSLVNANIMKLNDEELPEVVRILDLKHDANDRIVCRKIMNLFNLTLICLTRGEKGSLLVSRAESAEHPGFPAAVADTVGAGDAFTAVLAHHMLRGTGLKKISEAANRYGAWVASQTGATPDIDMSVRKEVC